MSDISAIEVQAARFPADELDVRSLFREYVESLGVDLSFQGVERELAVIPGKYAEPDGVIFIARDTAGRALGCVALRPLSARGVSEMKRLYVRPQARGRELGRRLAEAAIAHARSRANRRIVLDTLAPMHAAQRLYRALGFREVEAYYANPMAGTVYMALELC